MYGVSARPRSVREVATCDAHSVGRKARVTPPCAADGGRVTRNRHLLIPRFTLISCLLSMALSGCGGVKTENPETVQGSGGSGQGGTAVALLSSIACTSASVTGAG